MNDDELILQIFELKAAILENSVRIKAFEEFVRHILGEMGHSTEKYYPAIREIEQSVADELLKKYADESPTMATILKQQFDKSFPSFG